MSGIGDESSFPFVPLSNCISRVEFSEELSSVEEGTFHLQWRTFAASAIHACQVDAPVK